MATVEEKAAAFDAVVNILKGRHECVGHKRVSTGPPRSTFDYLMRGKIVCNFKDVPIYRWVIACDGDSNIESVLLKLGHFHEAEKEAQR